ncbi:MAG: PilZ domain-containing protein [Spirochaetes bacterium]|nr:PilZ domain-containing protein [Spirochaetota bacterium]
MTTTDAPKNSLQQQGAPVLLPLTDTQFFIHGESAPVVQAIERFIAHKGGHAVECPRLGDVVFLDDAENVLVVHYPDTTDLAAQLQALKVKNPALRVLLLHEFVERGKIDAGVLSATDHILEKPFTRAALEKAIQQFRFHPLASKPIFFYADGKSGNEQATLRMLGATVITRLPETSAKIAFEVAVFAPQAIDMSFREALQEFRTHHADVPVFLVYDPQAKGVLDSTILAETAYLLQRPLPRLAFRQKILAFFEQPQRERRKNPRKHGISQVWISAFNSELGTSELFESPFLIDISLSGLSFQSHIEYNDGQTMVVWVVSDEQRDKIIELHGHIRWQQREDAAKNGVPYKYGVEFSRETSEEWTAFARMIAMHSG